MEVGHIFAVHLHVLANERLSVAVFPGFLVQYNGTLVVVVVVVVMLLAQSIVECGGLSS